ncbi:MAG: DUF2238 domain-containing protein [Alphaproteobacteria bacterium]|nr:DUF2238 domain-containing protein [Alphaproteobacteria bacterium]
MRLKSTERAVLIFTLLYVAGFMAYFMVIGNREFLGYLATMVGLIALIAWGHHKVRFPLPLLWAFTGWGLAHMAGGGIPVNGAVLYNLPLLPIAGQGELAILKYDQLVHFYGFGITAWLLWHVLVSQYPEMRGTKTLHVFAALSSIGLGAVNEIVEFSAVMLVANTNVGGYFNTALDLVFNAAGAVTATLVCALWPAPEALHRMPRTE